MARDIENVNITLPGESDTIILNVDGEPTKVTVALDNWRNADAELDADSKNAIQNRAVAEALDQKVDKVSGKGLSTNDYTDADKTKLTDLPTDADLTAELAGKVDKETGKGLSSNDFTDAEKSKLHGIEAGAQVNTMLGVKGDAETDYRAGNVNITKENIGLGNVDNTADADKPISTATQTALSGKVDKVTGKGLSSNDFTTEEKNKLAGIEAGAEVNVQANWNESDQTSDAFIQNKPSIPSKTSELTNDSGFVTDATMQSALDQKVDKVSGKGLSTNDFTNQWRNKLEGIEEGAEVNVQANWDQTITTADDYIKNKPSIPENTSDLVNDSGFITAALAPVQGVKGSAESAYRTGSVSISKENIGLGNVDNTSDADKPISTAVQNELSALNSDLSSATTAIASEANTRSLADTSLRQAIDALVSPQGQSVVVDASLSISGAAADAKVAGDAVNDLKSELTDAVVEKNPSWRKGVYESKGYGAASSNTWRCSSKLLAGKYRISSNSVRFECYKYVSDTSGALLVGQRTSEITFISDGEFIVSFRKTDSSSLADMSDAELNALIDIQCYTVVHELNKRIDASGDSISYIGECCNHLDLSLFTIGSLANGVVNTTIRYRIATPNILKFDFDLIVFCEESHRFGVQTFIGETYNSDSGWVRYYTIPRGTRFKLVIRKEPEDASSIADIAEFAGSVYLLSKIARKATSEVYPYAYTGERIQIAQNRCHAFPVFSLIRPDSKPEFSLQGAASYGNTLVRTGLNGDVAIYDIENASGDVIPVAALTINTPDSHGNCANFSNIFYEADDALPLLYVTSSANDSPIAECSVVRISKNGETYSATIAQTITIDYTDFSSNGYEEYNIYPMWLIDDYLWCYGAKYKTNGTPQATDPVNKIIITKFAIPSISNSSVTLNADDVLDQFTCEYKSAHQLQGACIYNKKIYAPEGVTNRGYLNVYDVLHKAKTNELDFAANGYPITAEPEDTFICNDELYLATGSSTTYKFEF
jgi:hypothetical protein